nr:MAG TPA: integrase [Caudoviricetes sp.]
MYCLYLRKSRADIELEAKGELETLARHKKALLALAQKNNLTIGEIYEEIVSGETISSRPVVQQLLDEVENGKWDGVLVMEIERLARGDTIDQGIVARAFKIGNTKIITPSKTFDPNNEFDEEYFEFGLFMSRREYKTINRRIQRGRIASASEGKFIGSVPPYGYDKIKIKNDKGYTLRPNAQESVVVKRIYSMYLTGKGMHVIARELDDMGIKPRYRDTWSKSTLSDILTNPVYTGKLRWSYRQEDKYVVDGVVHKRRKVNASPIYVDGLHDPIISSEDFESAQKIRARNTLKTKPSLTLQNPLSGLVYCSMCGTMMTRQGAGSKNKYDTLRCPSRTCDCVSSPIFLVEQELLRLIQEWLFDYAVQSKNVHPEETDLTLYQSQLEEAKKEIVKYTAQLNKTYDLLEQGIYTEDVFKKRQAELSQKITEINTKSTHLKAKADGIATLRKSREEVMPKFISILELYQHAENAEQKNHLLRQLITKAVYAKNEPNKKNNALTPNFELHIYPNLMD